MKDWEAKVMAIEEACEESMQFVATLFKSLSEYEGKIKFKKGLDEISNKHKGIALNIVKEEKDEDGNDDEYEELGMMVQRFKRFYKKYRIPEVS